MPAFLHSSPGVTANGSFLPPSFSLIDCVIEETKSYPNTCVPCGGVIAICASATHSLPTYTPEVPHLSPAECSKHFIECVFVNTYYFLVLTFMNNALIPFNQYTYLPKIHVLFPYASSPLPMRDSLMTSKRQSSAKEKCLN